MSIFRLIFNSGEEVVEVANKQPLLKIVFVTDL